MIEQQLGFSLESFLRGIVGISTVLGVCLSDELRSETGRLEIGGWRIVYAVCLCSCRIVCPCSRNCSGMGGQGFY